MKTTKTIISIVIAFFLVMTLVSAATLVRTAPSTVAPGSTFTVSYSTNGAPSSKYFVAFEDTISGCTPVKNQNFMLSDTGGEQSSTKTFVAPNSGSCTFTGFYQYAGSAQANLQTQTVTVSGSGTTPVKKSNTTLYLILGGVGLLVLVLLFRKK